MKYSISIVRCVRRPNHPNRHPMGVPSATSFACRWRLYNKYSSTKGLCRTARGQSWVIKQTRSQGLRVLSYRTSDDGSSFPHRHKWLVHFAASCPPKNTKSGLGNLSSSLSPSNHGMFFSGGNPCCMFQAAVFPQPEWALCRRRCSGALTSMCLRAYVSTHTPWKGLLPPCTQQDRMMLNLL